MVTASISVISSIIIIVMILRSKKKLSETFHSITFGISLTNILLSVALSFGPILSPKGISTASPIKALGNQLTCNAQGFFYMIGASAGPLYAISLQLFFLLGIKYSISTKDITKKVEPFLHGVPILFGLIAGILPLAFESSNPVGYPSYYIVEYPFGCQGSICTRGNKVNPRLL